MSIVVPQAARRLDFSCAGVLMAPVQFDEIADYDECFDYELIDHRVIVRDVPHESETAMNEELNYLLRKYHHEHPNGGNLDATLGNQYVYTPRSRHLIGRAIWAGLGRHPRRSKVVPTIAVDFVSKSRRFYPEDYHERREEYFAVGVKEYWLIDRFERTLTVRKSLSGSESVVQKFEVYATDLLLGFDLHLNRILTTADEWAHVE